MTSTLSELLPTSATAALSKKADSSTSFDLSNAQNEVLRHELLEFFKTTVEDELTEKV